MKINVPIRRKDTQIEVSPCVVEKTIELGADEYRAFSQNLLDHYDFISENNDCMYERDGVLHCLLVLGKDQNDGILVESEGSEYARYSAFVPNARQLMEPEMKYESVLAEFCDKMQTEANKIVESAKQQNQDGMYRVLLSDYAPAPGEFPLDMPLLYEMLCGRPEFDMVEDFNEEIVIQVKPEYVQMAESPRQRISQEDADIMCAKHTLWLYDEGGEQADFSNCELVDLDLSRRKLNNALFKNTLICGTDFDGSELCFADFTGAELYDCSLKYISAEESVFRQARIGNCAMQEAVMTHSDFTDAEIQTTNMSHARMDNSCIAGITVDELTEAQSDMQNCCRDEQDWNDNSGPVLSM